MTGRGERGPRWAGIVALVAALGSFGCGSVEPLGLPDAESGPVPSIAPAVPEPASPAGTLTVGIPAEPTGWIVTEGDDLAALDLAALWALPLYRLDGSGTPVRALATAERIGDDGRTVEVDLADGEWSDGTPVVAEDVVATVEALRDTDLVRELDVVTDVVALDDRTVRFELEQPTVRWQLLLGPTGVLPRHVLADGGLDAVSDLEVTGGHFRLAEQEPGLGATFAAHGASPLGAPAVEELRVLVVPSYDAALGLLDEGRLDAVVGHLAVGAVRRAERLGLEAAAPIGGTWVGLRWNPQGPATVAARRGAAAVIDVGEQVQGLGLGEELRAPLFQGPPPAASPPRDRRDDVPELASLAATLVVRGDEEALTLTGRLIEAQLRSRDAALQLRRERTPVDVEVARSADGALVVRRDPPRPDLARDLSDDDRALARQADAAASTADAAVAAAVLSLLDDALVVPLYRPPVAHAWRSDVLGIEPSAWPGAGFSSAARWRLAEAS